VTLYEGVDIVCRRGAVATGPAGAARAGAGIFERGGNAMDAAAAACMACAVLEPQAVDLGGYVLAAVVLEGASGRVWSVDANSVAPAAARSDMYRVLPTRSSPPGINELEYGCSVENDSNVYGPLAVGVPGFLGGVGAMWERWGRLRWGEIVAPARTLVEGQRYSLVRNDVEPKREAIGRYPATAALLLPNGTVPPDDQPWPRPDLARTLDRLAAAGWRDFYDGEIGRAIADFVASQDGILTRDDMAAFAPRITEPLSSQYRGAAVHTAIAPNGGFSVLAALRDLERLPPLPDSDPEYWDRMAQTLHAMWTVRLAGSPPSGASPHGTTQVAAADAEGNLVSATISQGGLFGSCLAVPGTGIILGHGMCRFDPHPGLANSVGPGKRPLNNVCPLILRMPGRDVAIGARGGRRIVSVCVQMAQRIVDYGATARQAASAPRIHTLTGDPLEISANFDPRVRDALVRAGYRIEVPKEVAGAAHGAEICGAGSRRSRPAPGEIRAGGNNWAAGI
jgi:gamma-glutamyltranspeptidase/glutathione hydrolase